MEKVQWNSINNKYNGLEQSKNHPPSPGSKVRREAWVWKVKWAQKQGVPTAYHYLTKM